MNQYREVPLERVFVAWAARLCVYSASVARKAAVAGL